MPHHEISIDDVLCGAMDKKHHKKSCCPPKKDDCNVNCCVPDCNPDCCTPAFQRLDKLRVNWQQVQLNEDELVTSVFNRAGSEVTVPTQDNTTPYNSNVATTTNVFMGNNELASLAFVNQVRYLNYEECGKADQVMGWSVDLQSGELFFYQSLPDLGLTGLSAPTGSSIYCTGDDRAVLLNTAPGSLTPYDRRKLQEMEPFWKLSLKAVERVRENPKTEGNICEIKDKCGNRFLVAINRAVGQNGYPNGNTTTTQGASVCDYNSRYTIVAVKLC